MSDLVVLDFDGVGTADEVLTKLRGMQKEHLIDLEDACVVVHTENGKVQIKQALNMTAFGAARGASAGMLVGALTGLLLLNPLAGMAVGGLAGMGMGAVSGSLADYGINDDFIKNLGNTIPKGSSALFMLIKRSTPDKVLAGAGALQTPRPQDLALKQAGGEPARGTAYGSSRSLRRRESKPALSVENPRAAEGVWHWRREREACADFPPRHARGVRGDGQQRAGNIKDGVRQVAERGSAKRGCQMGAAVLRSA